jgi:glycosyltransferase involved in cell wall biosynthesis
VTTHPSVSIIVPTFKEAENLSLLIPQVAAALAPKHIDWELIVVDDNSPDNTRETLDRLALRYLQVRYLIRTHERGLSSAVIAGLQLAVNDIIVVMDADLSHPPESLPDLIDALHDADFVIGSRYVPGGKTESWSRFRWLNSAGATLLAKPLVGTVRDPMAGFFAFRRVALRQADSLNPIGYKIGLELIAKMRISPDRVAEVPITFRNRIHGTSKLTLKEQFRYLEHLSRLYDYRFPKAAPRSKFLIAAAIGTVACYAALLPLHLARLPQPISLAAGLVAMILVTLAFFARYVRAQRDFIVMKSPYAEFAAISFAEFLAGWTAAVATPAALPVQTAVGIAMLLLVRYTLRKVFLHDLRGLRGTPAAKPALRLSHIPATHTTAASA